MALVVSSSAHKSRSSVKGDDRPWMLKDYLLDDLGSCSSNGFRSFPRRQCCAAVRSLIEHEVRSRGSAGSNSRRLFNTGSKSSRSSAASSKISRAIRRASMAIISAVKLLPFRSTPATTKKKTLQPKSLSGSRLFKKKLWKKAPPKGNWSGDCDIERWISSGAAAAEKYEPSDLSNATTASTTITITTASTTSSTKSDGWSESDSELTQARPSVDENGVVNVVKQSSSAESKRCRVSATAGDDSIVAATTKKKWITQVEKEQLSPISVLKFPSEDEEAASSPSFARRLNNSEKLLQKLRRFSSQIDPINLETRLSPPKPTETEERVNRMIGLVKAKAASSNMCKYSVDSLLAGFFSEGLLKRKSKDKKAVEESLLYEAEEWVSGRRHGEVSVGWKAAGKRRVYVQVMEEGGPWRSGAVEADEVAALAAAEVLSYLVDELAGELVSP